MDKVYFQGIVMKLWNGKLIWENIPYWYKRELEKNDCNLSCPFNDPVF